MTDEAVAHRSVRRGARWLTRAWPWLKYLVGLGLAALALWALDGRRDELQGASQYLAHINWLWLIAAGAAELGSLVAFALVQVRLLRVVGGRPRVGRLTAVTLAATAIANSMPGGPVLSTVFAFRQYRRVGADDTGAGWTLVALFVASAVSLATLAVAGLALAGPIGADLDLVAVTIAVLLVTLLMAAFFVERRALAWVASAALRVSQRRLGRPRGVRAERAQRVITRLAEVRLTVSDITAVFGWSLANWVLDCACLVLSFVALGVGVPWRGLLLAYGAAQLAVNLPITPGGLGVVEGSLTVALVAFGGPETQVVAAVLLYRILSFWLELPVGWTAWGVLTWRRVGSPAALASSSPKAPGDATRHTPDGVLDAPPVAPAPEVVTDVARLR